MTFPLIANNARDHYLPVLLESTHNRDGTAGEKYPFGCSSHEGDVLFEDYYSDDPESSTLHMPQDLLGCIKN